MWQFRRRFEAPTLRCVRSLTHAASIAGKMRRWPHNANCKVQSLGGYRKACCEHHLDVRSCPRRRSPKPPRTTGFGSAADVAGSVAAQRALGFKSSHCAGAAAGVAAAPSFAATILVLGGQLLLATRGSPRAQAAGMQDTVTRSFADQKAPSCHAFNAVNSSPLRHV